ncbi:choice-of-anchor J domain-containing protein, partial [Flavobacterium coralii]|uniref:choice-of-anchor J domain-containing protein n=1 Tax=Flavobacterium coralii TaxID=2838017 RepID=UPI0032B20E77
GASGCGSTSAYLNGDDVVYSYTATANGTINIAMTGNGAWSGMFVYTSCANIGVNCAAGGVGGSAGNPVTIPNFAVTAGQTYYIVISTWATPQTTPYTLTIQQVFCAPPVGNPTTGITTTTANLSWTNPSGATSWEVAIQPVGTGVPTGAGTTVSSNTYTATSLTPSTQYEYYVRAACGDGNFSIWAGPYTFNTLCDSFGVPFTEGFNSTSPTQQCWTVLNLNGDTDVWNMDYALNAFEGNQSAAITTDFNAGNNNDWLISPTINLTGNQRLKFHQRVQSAGEPNDFRVVASTTGIDPASFTITLMPLASYNNTTYVEYIVNIVDATNTPVSGPVNIAWHVPNGGLDGWRLYIDNVIIEDIPSCPDPTALTATSITANSAQLGWTPGFNETSWEVVVQAPGTGVPTGAGTAVTGGTPAYAATGLTSNTQYEYYVRATCAVGDNSNWVGPFTFTTACDPLPIPFFEGFNSDSPTQNCWTVLNLNGDTDVWNMDYALNAFEGNQSAAITTDFNAGNNNDWLISPTLILTGNQRLKFHQRVQSTGEPNDFRVVLSTTGTNPADFTTTLIPLASYNNTTYVEYIVNIVDATNTPISGPVNIAWHVPNGGLDGWRLYVDNVIVEDIPTCPDPTALTAGNFTPNTADLSWTPGFTETSWEIVVQAPGTGEPTGAGTPVTVDPEYTATGLTANTTYEYYVRATCAVDDLSNWVGPFTFTTACDAFTVPFFEGFNAGSTTQPCWTVLNLNGDTDAWNMDYALNAFEGNQSAAITTDFNNGNNNDWLISPQIILTGNQRLKFHQRVQSVNEPDQFEVLVSTTGTNPADFTTVLLPLATYSNTTYQEFIINLFDGATPISGPVYIAWHIPSGGPDGWRLYVDNVIVEDIPTCPDPTNLVVVDATDTTVDLSWTAGLNETQWEVIVQPQGTGEPADTATGVIADSNTFTVTGLTPGEEYEVYIRAVCAVDDLSNWVGPVNFNTDVCAPADQCIYDFVMVDSFGDSWNGNTMSIIQNGITVATLTGPTNADDTNPVTVSVGLCTGIPFELFWNAGGSFAGEVGISVINTTYSETVYEKEPGQGSQNSLLYTGIPVCSPITCPQPTDLLSEGVNLESVQLSWVPGGAETQWEVVVQLQGDPYPGDTPADTAIVNGDPEYLAEGLTPSVFYEYYVRAICGPGDVSFWSGPYQFSIFAPPGCAGVDVYDDELEVVAPGSELTICPGEETCVDLSANYFEIGETTEYTVESIDYAPPFPFLGGQELNVTTDDIWSPVVNLPFEFCFYGETYDEAKVGSNGVVMFGDNMTNGGNCPWSYDESVPDPGFPILNAIYGVYQDINPAVAGSDVSINYQVLGSYPCRALVVNYYDVPQFSCGLSVGTQTTQIVIYEVSNIIEVYVESRTPCTGWNGGRGVIGLQNADGTEGITPPDRNTGAWTATEEAWRFLPSGDTNVVFEWLQDGDFYSNENDITVCVSGETEMTARATYTTCTGEQIIKESTFNINVAEPIEANEPQDLSLCSNGEEVTFDLTESLEGLMDDPTGYNFTFYATEEAAELGLTDNLPESYTTDTAQTIWVRITLGDSPCYITRSFELILNNVPPQFTATEDTTVCEGTPVTLEVFPGNFDGSSADVSYSWTLDGDDLGLTTQSITVTAAGIYEVTVNNGGCVGTEQIVVTTTPTPVPDAPADVTACDSYTLPALT